MADFPAKARFYLLGVVGLGLVAAIWRLWGVQLSPTLLYIWILLAISDLLCELYEVELGRGHGTSVAIAVCVGAVLVGGDQLGLLVVLTGSVIAELVLRRGFWRKDSVYGAAVASFNVFQLALSIVVSGLAFKAMGGHPPPYTTALDFVRAGVVFVIYLIVNAGLVSGIVHFTTGVSWWHHLFSSLRSLHIQILSLGFLAILIAVVSVISPWYIILLLSPLLGVQVSVQGYAKLGKQAKETFQKIAQIVNARDMYTGAHSEEVAKLAVKLARALCLPEEEVETIEAAARVHDLGKIAVPDAILLKTGPLTPEEWEIMKKHPVVSAELLSDLEIYKGTLNIIRHEHEHWDGSGYPDGLKGEQIPLGSRIIAVADVWHALISDRPYRKAYPKDVAQRLLGQMAGKELDPKLVDLFLKLGE